MNHNFFINSSVNGYLGCFYVLAIVNGAAMKNGIHVPLKSTCLTFLSEHQSNKNLNLVVECLHACMLREGNGNPLQYSCLENPMDGGAW